MSTQSTVVVNPPNLAELAATINRELRLSETAAEILVVHAVAVGKALLLARPLVRRGEWGRWLTANTTIGEKTARKYMRLADYEHLLGGVSDVNSGLEVLVGQPARSQAPGWVPQAEAMRAAGATYQRIADVFGVVPGTVRYNLDPRARRMTINRAMERAERYKALGQYADKRDAARAAAQGHKSRDSRRIAASHSRICLAAEALDALGRDAVTEDVRKRANAALRLVCRAEEEIVALLGAV